MSEDIRRYILSSGFCLRGWKLLPYAVQDHPTDYLARDEITCEYYRGGWKDKKDALLKSLGVL